MSLISFVVLRLQLQPVNRRKSPVCSYLMARCPSALRSTGRDSVREKTSASTPSLKTPVHVSSSRRLPSLQNTRTSPTDAQRWRPIQDDFLSLMGRNFSGGLISGLFYFRSCVRNCLRFEEITSSLGCATCGRGRSSECPNWGRRCSAVTSSRWTTPSWWVMMMTS